MPDNGAPSTQQPVLDQVVGELRGLITRELVAGAQLPAEAELAERFGVSRPTVREALRVLAGSGLVGMRRGRRAVVLEPSPEAVAGPLATLVRSDPRHVIELTEIQDALYMLVATLAAQNGRHHMSALAEAEGHLARMRRAPGRPEFDSANRAFHRALARCTDSRTLEFLLEAIEIALKDASHTGFESQLAPEQGRRPRGAGEVHQAILDAVHEESRTQAARAMRTHAQLMRRGVRDRVRALMQQRHDV